MSQTQLVIPQEASDRIAVVSQYIDALVINPVANEIGYDTLLKYTKDIKTKINELDEARHKITDPLEKSKKEAIALFKVPIERLKERESQCKSRLGEWDTKKENERIEAQRKADEIARKEREKQEHAAEEQRRKEEVARKKAEELRVNAEKEADEKKRVQIEKQAAKEESKAESAASKAEVKEMTAASVVSNEVQKTNTTTGKGIGFSMKYTGEVTDKVAFLTWALNAGCHEYLEINISLINKELQASKGQKSYPGIKVKHEKTTRVGGR